MQTCGPGMAITFMNSHQLWEAAHEQASHSSSTHGVDDLQDPWCTEGLLSVESCWETENPFIYLFILLCDCWWISHASGNDPTPICIWTVLIGFYGIRERKRGHELGGGYVGRGLEEEERKGGWIWYFPVSIHEKFKNKEQSFFFSLSFFL